MLLLVLLLLVVSSLVLQEVLVLVAPDVGEPGERQRPSLDELASRARAPAD